MGKERNLKEEEKKAKAEKAKSLENAALTGGAAEVVQRYGSANQAFLGAYDGIDYEAGKVLAKNIKEESSRYYEQAKKIQTQSISEEAKEKLLHQQLKSHAGFTAEVDEVAIENSKRIINKDPTRRIRTDDLDPSKGGQRNHPLYDHVDIDKNGNPIAGTESQMKIKGENTHDAFKKLMDQKNEKYLDKDVKMKIQKGWADDVRADAAKEIERLEQQKKALFAKPEKTEDLQKIQRQIDKAKKIEKLIEDSNVSNQESKDTILKPKTTTAKHTLETSHNAGLEAAKTGTAIAGGMALIRYSVAVAKGDMEPEEAALMVVKDTGTSAVVSYSTAFAGSQVQALMVRASTKKVATKVGEKVVEKVVTNTALKSLAESNLPAQIVTATIEVTKTMKKFIAGEIDGVECLTELGEKGTGMVASAIGATLGQIAIPIPVVGGIVGSMVGYALSTAYYNSVVSVLKDAKFTRQERERIEAECEEAIEAIREWRTQFEELVSQYMIDHIVVFHKAFDDIKTALAIGDIDGFISGTNTITRKLGKTPQFETFNEFDVLMRNGNTFKL